jgi:hypothetical protein
VTTSLHQLETALWSGIAVDSPEHRIGNVAVAGERSDRHVEHQVRNAAEFAANVLNVEHHKSRVRTDIHGADHSIRIHARSVAQTNNGHGVVWHDKSPRVSTAVSFCSESSACVESFQLRAAKSATVTLFHCGTLSHIPKSTWRYNVLCRPTITTTKNKRPVLPGETTRAARYAPELTQYFNSPSLFPSPRDHSQQTAGEAVSQNQLQPVEHFHA